MFRLLLCAGIATGLLAGNARASFISLRTDSQVETNEQKVVLVLRVTNRGDEQAKSVRVEAQLGDRSARGTACPVLGVEETATDTLDLGPLPAIPGTHQIAVRIRYADANNYPFTALFVIPLCLGELQEPDEVLANLVPLALVDKGEVKLKLKSLGARERDLKTRLLLPDELSCAEQVQNLVLYPGQEKALRYRIRNFSGRAGSTYAVFGEVCYVSSGTQHSVVSAGTVTINPPRSPFARQTGIWMTAIVLLLLGVIILQWRILRKTPASPPC